jgi:hypothetical protein
MAKDTDTAIRGHRLAARVMNRWPHSEQVEEQLSCQLRAVAPMTNSNGPVSNRRTREAFVRRSPTATDNQNLFIMVHVVQSSCQAVQSHLSCSTTPEW